ncbi:hypothetical protein AC1031_009230 [Aphanomyces cochlioides]|nr:hypothetical protein AC1031_009230 [Aphanomyces cochlioides]
MSEDAHNSKEVSTVVDKRDLVSDSTLKKTKKSRNQVTRTYVWCDDSVNKMFELRYKSELSQRFDSKNNYGKRVAYIMLAAELSMLTKQEFTAKQV